MATITIPEKIIKKSDLVIIPRQEYEEFLELKKAIPVINLTPSEKKDLKKAREEYRRGKCLTFEQFEHELGIKD